MTTPLAAEPTAALGPEVAAARAATSPAWLAARRRIAWDAYEAIPMPSSHSDEDWRRTDISALHPDRFAPLESVEVAVLDAMRAQRDRAAPDAALVIDAPLSMEPVRVRHIETTENGTLRVALADELAAP